MPRDERWREMRLDVTAFLAEVRHPALTLEQQGRMALAWPAVYLAGEQTEEIWRVALGYTRDGWHLVAEAFELGLPGWHLGLLDREWARQERESDRQRTNRLSRQPRSTAVNGGAPRSTTVHPAVAVASAVEEKNLEHLLTVVSENGSSPKREPKPEPEGFTRFWTAYKCDRRTDKPKALKVWAKLRLEPISDTVLAGLQRFKTTRKWREGFMPEPAKWLAAESWNDVSEPEDDGWYVTPEVTRRTCDTCHQPFEVPGNWRHDQCPPCKAKNPPLKGLNWEERNGLAQVNRPHRGLGRMPSVDLPLARGQNNPEEDS